MRESERERVRELKRKSERVFFVFVYKVLFLFFVCFVLFFRYSLGGSFFLFFMISFFMQLFFINRSSNQLKLGNTVH